MWPVVVEHIHLCCSWGDTYPFRKRQSSPKEELKEEERHLLLGTSHQFLKKKINERKKQKETKQKGT